MPGLAEILDENAALRQREALAVSRVTALEAELEQLRTKLDVLMASHDRFSEMFELMAKKKDIARSERFIANEQQALLFVASDDQPARDPVLEESSPLAPQKVDGRVTAKHPRKGRRNLKDLGLAQRVVHARIDAPACDTCGGQREAIAPQITHRIGWEPGQFTVIEVHQERCACPRCPKPAVWAAPMPFLLPAAMCDDALLARVIVDKFGDHIPLNRQARRMGREGFTVGVNVLCNWVFAAYEHAGRALAKAVMGQVANARVLLTDDSGLPVQDGSDGRLAPGRLWVFTDQQQAFFAFSRTKEGHNPAEVLAELHASGVLVADGGSEYNLTCERLQLERAGCWSHLRRYFHEAALVEPAAAAALPTIRDLFLIERQLTDQQATLDERLAARNSRSRTLVDGLYAWIRTRIASTRPQSAFGAALTYAINQEARLRVFLSNASVPLHNNLSELLLRQPIVGRKNWLFAGSEGGAEAAAAWYTLIASCVMQGIDPAVYLYDVFRRISDHSANWVHELTPWQWRLAVEAGDFKPYSPGRYA